MITQPSTSAVRGEASVGDSSDSLLSAGRAGLARRPDPWRRTFGTEPGPGQHEASATGRVRNLDQNQGVVVAENRFGAPVSLVVGEPDPRMMELVVRVYLLQNCAILSRAFSWAS